MHTCFVDLSVMLKIFRIRNYLNVTPIMIAMLRWKSDWVEYWVPEFLASYQQPSHFWRRRKKRILLKKCSACIFTEKFWPWTVKLNHDDSVGYTGQRSSWKTGWPDIFALLPSWVYNLIKVVNGFHLGSFEPSEFHGPLNHATTQEPLQNGNRTSGLNSHFSSLVNLGGCLSGVFI